MPRFLDEEGRFDPASPWGRAALALSFRYMALRDRIGRLDVSYRVLVRPRLPRLLLRISDKSRRIAAGLFTPKGGRSGE